MKNNSVLLVILFALTLQACENTFFVQTIDTSDPYENFDYLWNQVNNKYSFLEYKGVDWVAIRSEYRSRIYAEISNDSLFNIMGGMLNELRDGHVNLVSSFNISRFDISRLGPKNIDFRLLEENYLPKDYYITGPFKHDFIANGQVGYLRFDSFTGTVDDDQLDFMLTRYKDTKGLVLDLRQNGGGDAADIYKIIGRFITTDVVLWRSSIKSGAGANDFSAEQESIAKPEGDVKYNKPVMVLIDRGTYSAGSFFSLASKALANFTLVGDTTGGGLGMPNGGQLPNGWIYRFSITRTLDLNGNNYEDGVPPDILSIVNQQDFLQGRDTVLERALEELL